MQAQSPLRPDAETYLQKAETFAQKNQLDSAVSYFLLASGSFSRQQQWAESIEARSSAAALYFQHRKSSEAIQSYTYLLDSLSAHLNDSLRGSYYFNIGISYARQAQFVEALENVRKSCELRKKVLNPDDLLLAESFHNLGRLYFVIGNYQQSLECQKKYLHINQQHFAEDHIAIANALHYIGLSYSRLFEHDLALQYYFKSMEILENGDEKYRGALADVYNNIGLVYGRQKMYEEEKNYVLKGIAIKQALGQSYASNLNNLGRAYLDLGQYDKALPTTHESIRLKIQEVGDRHSTVASSYLNLAELHQRSQRYDSALIYTQKALAIHKDNYGKHGRMLAESYYQEALIYQALQQWDHALHQLQEGLGAVVKTYDKTKLEYTPTPEDTILDELTTLKLMHRKAEILIQRFTEEQKKTDLILAHQTNMAASQLIDQIYQQFNNPESRTFVADYANRILETALYTITELQKTESNNQYLAQAFQLIEKNKAQLLLSNIMAAQWKQQAGVADSLLIQEQELNTRLAYYEKLLFEEQNNNHSDSQKVRQYQSKIFALHRQEETLNQKLKAQYPQYYHMAHEQQYISLAKAKQELIKAGQLMIEYLQGDSAIYALAISQEEVRLYRSNIDELPLEPLLQSLRQREFKLYSQAAYKLYRVLLQPILDEHTADKLIIIPDNQLGYIPFEALLSQPPQSGDTYKSLSYLIHDYAVAYQYSANLLATTRYQAVTEYEHSFAGYAPAFSGQRDALLATRSATDRQLLDALQDLPYAQEEVQNIAQLLKGSALTNQEATEKNFKATAVNSRIIHLASHTLINDHNPLYSKLVFAPEEAQQSTEDGLLHTYELYNMKLNAEMVTLSACNTGVGKIKKGEGIISLARGFMYAGVPNVLMSLWAVSDRSTSQLMQNFYQALNEGDEKAEALRTAKLRYLQQADANTAAPYYWSGFVLISNNQKAENTKFSFVYFLLPLLALILAGWYFLRKKVF